MADEEKVAAARVAIARGIAGKHARGGDLELKGYRPKPGGKTVLKSEIPVYDAQDGKSAAAARLRSRVLWRRFERAAVEEPAAMAKSRIEGVPGEAGGIARSAGGETMEEGGRDGLV